MDLGPFNKRVLLFRSPRTSGDSDGFLEALSPPKAWVSIAPLPAGQSDGRAILSEIRMRYHAQVTIDTILTMNGRSFNVLGVQNVDEDNTELRLLVEEVQP